MKNLKYLVFVWYFYQGPMQQGLYQYDWLDNDENNVSIVDEPED